MRAHHNSHLVHLLTIIAAAIIATATFSSPKLIDTLTEQVINLSQIQTRQALAKLKVLKAIVGAEASYNRRSEKMGR
ncbi:hypothetical protein AAAK29_20955 [Mesorhizobium sp. CCNWLW179-1]|uniref:hypothetical protein n=1 Tax=unclassified Mesorhizobium TaxID=325217 RepID=UPI0030141E7C